MKRKANMKRIVIFAAAVVLIAGGIAGFALSGDREGLIMDILSLLATLIGTVFIAVELRNSQVVTCCDMLIQLNNYFHDSGSIMSVYETLEREYAGDKDPDLWNDVRDSDVTAYCTFFENIYLLVKNNIAKMDNIDALFGYRFFLFTNNRRIQEKYILPTSSSYTEIFELYETWQAYRKKQGNEGMTVNSGNAFSEKYLKNELYMHDQGFASREVARFSTDRTGEFTVKIATFNNLSDIIALQQRVYEGISDKSVYGPLTREELIESLHLDRTFCVWCKDTLAAFAVFVVNRKTDRNLSGYFKNLNSDYTEVLTFDAVAVDEQFRGNGIQAQFIDLAEQLAQDMGVIKYIAATVSPDNGTSARNFENKGFVIENKGLKLYGGLTRNLWVKNLTHNTVS